MLNFKDFCEAENKKAKESPPKMSYDRDNLYEAASKIEPEKLNAAKTVIDKYSSMSEGDLMKEIAKEVGKQKGTGKFDKKAVKNQIGAMSGILSKEQMDKMNDVLDSMS